MMYRYIENHDWVWCNGVILKRGSSRAEVIENLFERRIYIRFSGTSIGELRAIIGDTIDEISKSYHKLKYEKMIPCKCSVCINNPEPNFFEYSVVKKRQERGSKPTIECAISEEDVAISLLLEDIDIIDTRQFAGRQLSDMRKLINSESQILDIKFDQRKKIIDLNFQDDSDLAKTEPDVYQAYTKAYSLENQEKFLEAEREYKQTIDLEKYYLKAWEGLERIYRILGENDKQLSALEQVQLIRSIIDFEENVAQKITLQQLQLTNLDFFGNSNWTFQPQINILLGKNGYGKSHLLRLIISLLQKDDNISSEFFTDKLSNASMKLTLERNKAEQVIHRSKTVFEESIGKVPVLAIPDLRYIDKSKNTISLTDNEKGDLREAGAYNFLYQKSFEALIQNFLYELCIMFLKERSFELPIFQLLHNVVQELTDEAFKFHEIKPIGNARFEINVITDGNNDVTVQGGDEIW